MLDEKDIALVRALQDEGAYLTEDPFGTIASRLGWERAEVLERARRLKEAGVIRRFGAALTPGKAGFKSNAMVAWEVSPERVHEAGEVMASHPRISHCYIRRRFEGFPYNLYTMIHASSAEDLERIIEELSKSAKITSYRALHSLREFKKSSPVYYPKALEPGQLRIGAQR